MKRFFAMGLLAAAAAAVLVGGLERPAAAQDFPTKPVTLIIGQPPGSAPDSASRYFAQKFEDITGQSLIIENKPGATGTISAQAAAGATPDGYTLFLGSSGAMSANPSLFKNLPYDPVADFVPVMRMFRLAFALMVNPEKHPEANVEELTAALKKQDTVNYGTFSASMIALAAQYVDQTGIEAQRVNYANSTQMMKELETGQLDFVFGDASYTLAGKAGIKGLAIALDERSELIPDMPTMAEAGMKDFRQLFSWFGIYAPTGVPEPVQARLAEVFGQIVEMPETREFLAKFGGEPFAGGREETAKFQAEEAALWVEFVKMAKIEPQ